MVATQVKKFELQERIGEGSFGEVYLAQDPERGKKIAVKYLRLDSNSPNFGDALNLFKREFGLLRELKHPHLASVYDFGFDRERKQYFFSSEFCEGKDLAKAIQGKPVDYFENILVQILSALDYTHAQGVVHSDIKPENILVEDRQGVPFCKLLDFGVAGKLRARRQGVGGSPSYMAPELLGANPSSDARADLYSLGMVALELLTGDLPFDRNNTRAAIQWQLRGKIPESAWRAREIPHYLRELTEKLLKKNPSERFSNARVVLNFLNLATGGRYESIAAELRPEIPLEGPLVERREEVLEGLEGRIRNFFQSGGSQGLPGALLLCGERGIGKTRLLEELRHFLSVQEIPSFFLTADWEIPTWPRLSEALNLPPMGHDNLDREWQLKRRIDILREAAKKEPICLLIDDLHKAEGDFKETLLRLFETGGTGPASNPVPLFVVAAGEEENEKGIALKRISSAGVLQYVQDIMGRDDGTQGLAEVLFRYSGGLPLLVAEGLRYLAPRFHRGEPLEEGLPSGKVAALYYEKIQSLFPLEEKLLHLVALLYRPVPESDLAAVMQIPVSGLGDLAKRPMRLGLLSGRVEVGGEDNEYHTIYSVNSQALATGLIEGMEPDHRQMLHRMIAEGLQQTGRASLEELAYHYSKAGRVEAAVDFYERAGQALEGKGQIGMATRCYSKALQWLQEGSAHWQERITQLTRLHILSGSYQDAEACLKKMESFPSWKGDELRGWLAFKRRDFSAARRHYERSLDALSKTQILEKILIKNALGNVDLQEGRPQEATERFQRALELEKSLPLKEQTKINNNNLGIALYLIGDGQGALDFYAERSRRLEGKLKPEDEIALLNGRAYVSLQTGHYEDSISYLKRAMVLAEESGAMHPLSTIMGNLITALIKESRYSESLSLLQRIVAFQERLGNPRDVSYSLLRQGSVYLTLGMGEKAKACFQTGKGYSQHTDKGLSLWYLLVEGYWEKDYGNPDRAKEIFRELELEAEKSSLPEVQAWGIYSQADLAFEQKRIAESRALLSKINTATQDKEFIARLHLLEAKLSAAEKREDSDRVFTGVEGECLAGNFREILWEVYYEWALNRKKRQGVKAAQPLFEKGVQVVEAIVGTLPEEYRDRYLGQNLRRSLFQEWKNSQLLPLERMTSRIKQLLGFKSGSQPGTLH